ncbi:MAG: spermidine synthase [Rubritalea sp.]|jgi:spermidine synthase
MLAHGSFCQKVALMKPYEDLGESRIDEKTVLSLHKRDGEFYLKYNGNDLMSTAYTYSEEMLADMGCKHILPDQSTRPEKPRVLIGGLGLGFTLKRALQLVGKPATVEVAELMQPLIEWSRTFLVECNGPLLEDPRTLISHGDLFDIISNKQSDSYDALLLDIDNTPDDLIKNGNHRLYTPEFLKKIQQILTTNGKVSYWLSEPAPKFKKLLEKVGFEVVPHAAKSHARSKRARHCIYVCSVREKKK